MRRSLRARASPVGVALASTMLIACAATPDELRERAPRELRCDTVEWLRVDEATWRASGCGRDHTYRRHCAARTYPAAARSGPWWLDDCSWRPDGSAPARPAASPSRIAP